MTSKLKVKTESLPQRCEICHQSDCFDAQSNFCSRCSGVPQIQTRATINIVRKAATLTDAELGVASGMSVGMFIGIIFWCNNLVKFSIYQSSDFFLLIFFLSIFISGLWGIHGLIVGMIMGRSINASDGADGALTASVVAGALSNTRNRRGWQKFAGLLSGAFWGSSIIFLFLLFPLAISILNLNFHIFLNFILKNWPVISFCALCGMINGAPIGFLIRNRSDRRNDPRYLPQ
jgi:hypothetical protein